jgi:hypothetical protein
MSNESNGKTEEVTLDGELRKTLKRIDQDLCTAFDLCRSLIDNKGREKKLEFYRALGGNLDVAHSYVRFSSVDYMREGR